MAKRLLLTIVAVVLIASITGGSLANAGGWSFDWDLGSLKATGWASSTESALVTINGSGTVYARCRNLWGTTVLGTKPLPFDTLQADIFLVDLLLGLVNIEIASPDPTLLDVNTLVTPWSAGCPSSLWTVVGLDTQRVDWTGAHITVVGSLSHSLLYDLSFTCDTEHDASGIATDVECTHVP